MNERMNESMNEWINQSRGFSHLWYVCKLHLLSQIKIGRPTVLFKFSSIFLSIYLFTIFFFCMWAYTVKNKGFNRGFLRVFIVSLRENLFVVFIKTFPQKSPIRVYQKPFIPVVLWKPSENPIKTFIFNSVALLPFLESLSLRKIRKVMT